MLAIERSMNYGEEVLNFLIMTATARQGISELSWAAFHRHERDLSCAVLTTSLRVNIAQESLLVRLSPAPNVADEETYVSLLPLLK